MPPVAGKVRVDRALPPRTPAVSRTTSNFAWNRRTVRRISIARKSVVGSDEAPRSTVLCSGHMRGSAAGGLGQRERIGAGRDADLIEVLELATEEELEQLYDTLHGSSLLSPLAKQLQGEPPAARRQSRGGLIRHIERRFRFLAADAQATLRGTLPTYRETLLAVHHNLAVPCSPSLATQDLESEIFLYLLREHADAVDAASRESYAAKAAAELAADGDGMAPPPSSGRRRGNILQRALAPLKLGAAEVAPALGKLGAVLAVTNVHTTITRSLGSALATRTVQLEAALQVAVSSGSKGWAGALQGRLAVSAAQRGLSAAASRYALARSVLSFVGPLMWASTFFDLALMSVGTDHARVVRAVFALAQIRLLRTRGWTQGPEGPV